MKLSSRTFHRYCWLSSVLSITAAELSAQALTESAVETTKTQDVAPLSHDRPAGISEPPTGQRVFFLLPEGYAVSGVSENGAVLLNQFDGLTISYTRWYYGEMTSLTDYDLIFDNDLTQTVASDINSAGDIAITTTQTVYTGPNSSTISKLLFWDLQSQSPSSFTPKGVSYGSIDDFNGEPYRTSEQYLDYEQLDLLGRSWFVSPDRVGNDSYYGGYSLSALYCRSPGGPSKQYWPFRASVGSPNTSYQIYGISESGIPIGRLSNFEGASTTYIVGTKPIDFWPMQINLYGTVLVKASNASSSDPPTLVWYPDGVTEPLPTDGYPESIDDQTSEDEPYYFWVNNDNDSGSDDEAEDLEPTSGHDYLDGQIDSARDLEDFSRLWINVDGIADQLKDGSLRLGLEWKNVSEGDPAIRLYDAVEVDGGMKYLFDENVANQQKSTAPPSPYAAIAMEESAADGRIFFPEDFWDDLPADGIVHFLFEATSPGKGELVFSLQANTAGLPQDIDMSMSGVWFDLKDIKKMYQHFTVATPDNSFMGEEEINPALVATEINGVGEAELDEMLLEDHYILFVHGWRMKAWERRGFAETAFKRLYWQGYKGRFGMFSWPTEWIPRLWWLADTPDISEPRNFSKSERKGMLSANGLRGVLTTLSGQYSSSKVHMFGHSLGNVVCSEALRLEYESNGAGDLINSYIACQSATAAHWYDGVGPELIETDESTTTPEVYRNYPIENQPYFSNIDSAAGTTVNFHNHQDNAMVGWLLGQDLKRIDPFWYYDEDDSRWYRNDSLIGGIVGIPDTALFFPADRYEIFAHIAEARSTSLGAAVYGQFSVAGSIDDEFDLNSDFSTTALNYGNAQEDHSAQFRSTNMRRSEFYRTLLDFMGL
jgi:hypothetical protein